MESIGRLKGLPSLSIQIALGTMVWMINLVDTESVPLGLTGLFLAPFIFVISGILSARQALFHLLRSHNLDIYIRIYNLPAAFQRWGLDKRIAYFFAMLYKGNNPQIAVLFIICLPDILAHYDRVDYCVSR